jgi:capsule polysaccharide modification protein KpsS
MSVRAFLFEFAYFRPFTLTVEEKGLNDYNSVPRDPDFFRRLYSNVEVDFDAILNPSTAVFTPNKDLLHILGNSSNHIEERSKLARQNRQKKPVNLKTRYVFVPFQVESDTQIVEHSPHIKSMRNLVAITAEAVFDYNQRYNDDLRIVYKPHPVDVNLKLDYIEQFIECYPHAEISYAESTPELIANASLVITINSTVGIEALIQKKPVLTLGNAFYAIPGLVSSCKNYDHLHDAIKKALDSEIDVSFVFKYLKYLREEYFQEIYYEGADLDSIRKLADRLLKNWPASPFSA